MFALQRSVQPDRHNWWHQKFCTKPECRQASKVQSQRQWLKRPENRDVFRGSANVERVRQWRDKHPGYWKRPAKGPKESSPEPVAASGVTTGTCGGKLLVTYPHPPYRPLRHRYKISSSSKALC